MAPVRAEPTAVRRLGSLLRTPAAFPFLALLQGTVGTPRRCLQPRLGLPWPLPFCSSPSPRGHRFSCHVERKLPACLQEQLGLVPSAVARRLQQATQFWLCPGEPGTNGSALALAQDLWGALGLGGWRRGPQGVHFSRASTFSHSPAHGEPTLAKGEAVEPPERDAEGCV